MVELTNGIGLKPRYFVTEVSIEHVEAGLRQRPAVDIADVHLQRKERMENEIGCEHANFHFAKCCATFQTVAPST